MERVDTRQISYVQTFQLVQHDVQSSNGVTKINLSVQQLIHKAMSLMPTVLFTTQYSPLFFSIQFLSGSRRVQFHNQLVLLIAISRKTKVSNYLLLSLSSFNLEFSVIFCFFTIWYYDMRNMTNFFYSNLLHVNLVNLSTTCLKKWLLLLS